MSNNPPKCVWRGEIMSCGSRRQCLHVDGRETPFFIDSAMGVMAHRSSGDEHGLFGAGMGPIGRNGIRIAAELGSSSNVRALKQRAEQMAMAYAD